MSYNIQKNEFTISSIFEMASSRLNDNSSGSATKALSFFGMTVDSGSDAASKVLISYTLGDSPPFRNNNIRLTTCVRRVTQGTDYDFMVGWYDGTAAIVTAGGMDYTKKHVGFKCNRVSSGAETWSATVGNGTTESAVGISVPTGGTSFFTFIYSSTNIQFYLNGVYACSITTNIPTIDSLFYSNGSDPSICSLMLSNRASSSQTTFRISLMEFTFSSY